MKIVSRIVSYIPENAEVILALSGGPDSVFLFYQFLEAKKRKKINLICAHLHHGIRKEADEDLDFVINLCKRNDIPLVYEKKSAPNYAKENKMSVEEAGRFLRYDLFYRLAGQEGYISLAHHLQDQVETVLMRLMRGTGIHGLGGMRLLEGKIFRPMLDISKEDILSYLDSKSLSYCIDKTNFQAIYARNRIRLDLIPEMKTYNPNLDQVISSLAIQCQETEDYFLDITSKFIEEKVLETSIGLKVEIKELQSLHKAIQSRVFRTLIEKLRGTSSNLVNQNIQDIFNLLKKGTGKEISLPDGYIVRISYDYLFFEKKEDKVSMTEKVLEPGLTEYGPWIFDLRQVNIEEIEEPVDHLNIYLSSILGLSLRSRRPGDKINLLNQKGSKKIKDLFIDKKVDRRLRDTWPLVLQGDEIIWVPKLYTSIDCKIKEEVNMLYELKIRERK